MGIFQKADDGFITTNGYKTYYKIIGGSKKQTPIVCINGGPGASHEYLLSLSALGSERPVVFYDQFGAGRSEGRDNANAWKMSTFVEQLQALRNELKLKEVHLLGHSWGGMLLLHYMKGQPKGVKSLVLASTMYDVPSYMEDVDMLLKAISPGTHAIARQNEKNGSINSREYKEIIKIWDRTHIYHGTKPNGLDSYGGFNTQQYNKMWGASEFVVSGNLRDWSAKEWMSSIEQPTLVIAGEYDEVTESMVHKTANELPNAEFEIIEEGAHLVHIENPKSYLRALRAFLQQHDS